MATAKQVTGAVVAGVAVLVMVALLVAYVLGYVTPSTPWTP